MTDQSQTTDQSAGDNPPDPQSGSGTNTTLIIVIVIIAIVIIGGLAAVLIYGRDNTGEVALTPAVGSPVPPEISVPTPLPNMPIVTALTVINLRSGPGTNYPSYGVAPEGAQGVVIGISEDGDWWVVQVQNTLLVPEGQAWVSAEFVSSENTEGVPVLPSPEQPPNVEVPPPDPNAPRATALDAVNVRSGPGTNYASYGVAPKGAQGEIIGISEDGQWWVVKLTTSQVGIGQGWVSAAWVLAENTAGVQVIPSPP